MGNPPFTSEQLAAISLALGNAVLETQGNLALAARTKDSVEMHEFRRQLAVLYSTQLVITKLARKLVGLE